MAKAKKEQRYSTTNKLVGKDNRIMQLIAMIVIFGVPTGLFFLGLGIGHKQELEEKIMPTCEDIKLEKYTEWYNEGYDAGKESTYYLVNEYEVESMIKELYDCERPRISTNELNPVENPNSCLIVRHENVLFCYINDATLPITC